MAFPRNPQTRARSESTDSSSSADTDIATDNVGSQEKQSQPNNVLPFSSRIFRSCSFDETNDIVDQQEDRQDITIMSADGCTTSVNILPSVTIAHILDVVMSEWGLVGDLFAEATGEQLDPTRTVKDSGLPDKAVLIHFAVNDFTRTRGALIALRNRTQFEGWEVHAKRGWTNLEYCWEPGELNACSGVVSNDEGVHLDLTSCKLTGSIPLAMCECISLVHLDLRFNHISGEIPPAIGKLENLESLVLRGNHLTGSIPPEIGQLKCLQKLWLSRNKLSGPLPKAIGNLRDLKYFLVNNNKLSGDLGAVPWGNLKQIVNVGLEHNNFSGSIPSSFGQCSLLKTLDIRSNTLIGSIPEAIGQCQMLADLRMADNNLEDTTQGRRDTLRRLLPRCSAIVA
jgi:Leucine-rich repeat (LRR) protein